MSDEGRGSESDTCTNCGEAVVTDEWHPVATELDRDGSLIIHTFCSMDCREDWQLAQKD